MNLLKKNWLSRLTRDQKVIGVLIIIHAVGVVGIKWIRPGFFLDLTPIHLLVSFILLLVAQKHKHLRFWLFVIASIIIGFGVEYLGVRYGFLFGTYEYGSNLGPKWGGIPPVIGINWAMLVLAASESVRSIFKIKSPYIKAAIAATVLVLLDVIIEPDAIKFDFWSWSGGIIPPSNYGGWWLVAWLLAVLYFWLNEDNGNNAAIVLLILQISFFIFV